MVSARHIRQLIAELHRAGTTIFLTTHYIEEAERLCERIAFIVSGQIVMGRKLYFFVSFRKFRPCFPHKHVRIMLFRKNRAKKKDAIKPVIFRGGWLVGFTVAINVEEEVKKRQRKKKQSPSLQSSIGLLPEGLRDSKVKLRGAQKLPSGRPQVPRVFEGNLEK